MIEVTAWPNALPVDFFGRLIWQESRFQPDLVGPLARSGAHAEGVAQFMPDTAVERGLFEPFNPVKALAKSGAFPAARREDFGNLGLAAAAHGHVCFTLKIGGINETTNLSLENPTPESLAYLNLPKLYLPLCSSIIGIADPLIISVPEPRNTLLAILMVYRMLC